MTFDLVCGAVSLPSGKVELWFCDDLAVHDAERGQTPHVGFVPRRGCVVEAHDKVVRIWGKELSISINSIKDFKIILANIGI